MKGLNSNFFQGNRSEILADYLLSKIGIAHPVRRQFDIGTDFYCNLFNWKQIDTDPQYLTFGAPFSIQTKSASAPDVVFGTRDPYKWRESNLLNIFQNQIPFFIGIVAKDETSIEIYDTTGLWQIYNDVEKLNCSEIVLKPGKTGDERNNHKRTVLEGWQNSKADGISYLIDMGNPIISINDGDTKESCQNKALVLKIAIDLEQGNITNRNIGVKCFWEIKNNEPNISVMRTGMNMRDDFGETYIKTIQDSIRLPLITLSNNLFALGRVEESQSINKVLQGIPPAPYYQQLLHSGFEQYDWMREMVDKQIENDPRNIIGKNQNPKL